ncbi:MAG: PEGA domain-containing protein [archaeon]|nr:PEGA domain-containing protein [archaeon]
MKYAVKPTNGFSRQLRILIIASLLILLFSNTFQAFYPVNYGSNVILEGDKPSLPAWMLKEVPATYQSSNGGVGTLIESLTSTVFSEGLSIVDQSSDEPMIICGTPMYNDPEYLRTMVTYPVNLSLSSSVTTFYYYEFDQSTSGTTQKTVDAYYYGQTSDAHFEIYYDKNDPHIDSTYLSYVVDAAINSWSELVPFLGSPYDQDGDGLIEILIVNLNKYDELAYGGGVIGYVQYNDANGLGLIYLDNNIDLWLSWNRLKHTFSHEFTHRIEFSYDPSEQNWIKEGIAQFGGDYAWPFCEFQGYVNYFQNNPDVQLTGDTYAAYYCAAYVFFEYVAEEYGTSAIRTILERTSIDQGKQAVENALGVSFDILFNEFAAKNYVNDYTGTTNTFEGIDIFAVPIASHTVLPSASGSNGTNLWATDYVKFTTSEPSLTISFSGDSGRAYHVKVIKVVSVFSSYSVDDVPLTNNKGFITISGANTYSQIALMVTRHEDSYSSASWSYTASTPGYVTVTGYFYYYDDNTLSYMPIRYAYVELWDDDTFSSDDFLGSSYTDSSGYSSIGPVSNSDPEWGTQDVYVIVYADNTAVRVVDGSYTTWSYKTETQSDVPDGIYDIGSWTAPSTDDGAYNIYNVIINGHQYVDNRPNTDPPSEVTAVWYPGSTDGTYYNPGTQEIHLLGYASDPDEWDNGIILHEYGHHIANLYNIDNSPGGTHTWAGIYSPELAWSEGWAHYFSCVVRGSPSYRDTTSVGWAEYNLETGIATYSDGSSSNGNSNGDSCEASVAGILWDIYDSADDDQNGDGIGDTLSTSDDLIWDVIHYYSTSGHGVYTIHEFWDGWFARAHDYLSQMNAIFWEHGVDKNNPPSCTITSPNSGGWFSGVITINASASDIDGSISQVVFQYSTDGSSWYDIGTDYSSPWSVQWDTGTISYDSTVWVRARAYDGMEWGNWDSCDHPFGVDNTPPSCSIVINNGDAYTTSTSVILSLTHLDAGSGTYQVRYSNDGVWDTEPWESPSPTKAWSLAAGDGTKTVYYQLKDYAGLTSTYSDTIILDTTPPDTLMTTGPTGTIDYNDISFSWSGSDNIASSLVYSYWLVGYDRGWSPWTTTTNKEYNNLPGGDYKFKVKAKDKAGNEDLTPAEVSFKIKYVGTITVYVRDSAYRPIKDAQIYLDGKYVGLTNSYGKLVIQNAPTGSQVVKATKAGYNDASKTVTVYKGTNTNVAITMSIKTYTITVYVKDSAGKLVSYAYVYLDGVIKGTTDYTGKRIISNVAQGQHTIKVKKFGYSDYSTSIDVVSDMTLTIYLSKL